ncbi:helix-turn-helix domain-containing protein [Pedobacter petrophilus]|uniref:Helix-turn-helix domain-containing protein n=1 Tax=Pedobacter petrophilus TaxID=1908241 RepID=A0A7K0FY00_9SPHI|nr:helix-turn-helix domain-containing protein [Pedobacter petrophilus]MRX76483.1 helix-turn-helix domain-containing protein [Pedobacter petrophilus]
MQKQLNLNPIKKNGLIHSTPASDGLEVSRINQITTNVNCNQPFRSTFYGFVLMLKGKINIKTSVRNEILKEHDIFFIFPDSVYEVLDHADFSFIKITISKDYLSKEGLFLGASQHYNLFQAKAINKFALTKDEYHDIYYNVIALEKKLKIAKDMPYRNDVIRNSFIEILYDLLLSNNSRKDFEPPRRDSKFELTTKFLDLLSEYFRTERQVIFYAGKLFITPRHLSQVVKAVTGKTAGELIDEIVIGEAKILLANHSLNISGVAEALNFSNSSFFGKYFKKNTSLSPSVYRMANRLPKQTFF